MKERKLFKRILITGLISLFAVSVWAKDVQVEKNVRIITIDEDQNIETNENSQKAFMGIYTEDLSLKDMRNLEYPNNYGVLITGVTKNSNADKYGLLKDDIMMKINDKEISDKSVMTRVIDSHKAGDSVNVVVWRLGKEKNIPFVFGSKKVSITVMGDNDFDIDLDFDEDLPFKVTKKSSGKSTGFGGGTWMPIWTMINMDDVNSLVSRLGFNKMDDKGILLNGGGGKITVGKSFFIGGMGAGYNIDRKASVLIPNMMTAVANDSINVQRRMNYHNYFWAVTLDKRYAITKSFITSIGFGIGAAGQSLEIAQNGDQYTWDNMQNQFGNSYNNYVNLSKDYIIVHPKLELMYRLNGWLALRAEGGYVYGYSWHNNWKNSVAGDTYEVSGDNNTKYQGYTVSVGPWFGF